MSEPAKQQMGDGQDNFGQAAGKAAQAAKQASKEAAKQAAAKGAEATANAAANTVKAGVEGGKAVAEIAAGTASGGPWGAIISAAWATVSTVALFGLWPDDVNEAFQAKIRSILRYLNRSEDCFKTDVYRAYHDMPLQT